MIEQGDVIGRWTIVRAAPAAKHRPTDNGVRARWYVRCVCGTERILWHETITAGATSGCRSYACQIRSQTIEEVGRILALIGDDERRQREQTRICLTRLRGWARAQAQADEQRRSGGAKGTLADAGETREGAL